MRNQSGYKLTASVTYLLLGILLILSASQTLLAQGKTENSPDWFYPAWAVEAKYSQPIVVRDTESALGRYTQKTKEIGLKDLARIHGHLCDGLVIAFVEIKAVLEKFFPDGIVDRTDLRAVSKNGPCGVDAVMVMTGARINFQTLRIDASVGDGFIIQRISTDETYDVHLKPGVFPDDQAAHEAKIRQLRYAGKPASASDISKYEAMAGALSKKLLNTPPDNLLIITPKPVYKFRFNDLYDSRGDIINKDMPR